jgi:hypothetical protein
VATYILVPNERQRHVTVVIRIAEALRPRDRIGQFLTNVLPQPDEHRSIERARGDRVDPDAPAETSLTIAVLGCVTGERGRIWVASPQVSAECTGIGKALDERARTAAIEQDPDRVFFWNELPRTETGKLILGAW